MQILPSGGINQVLANEYLEDSGIGSHVEARKPSGSPPFSWVVLHWIEGGLKTRPSKVQLFFRLGRIPATNLGLLSHLL